MPNTHLLSEQDLLTFDCLQRRPCLKGRFILFPFHTGHFTIPPIESYGRQFRTLVPCPVFEDLLMIQIVYRLDIMKNIIT